MNPAGDSPLYLLSQFLLWMMSFLVILENALRYYKSFLSQISVTVRKSDSSGKCLQNRIKAEHEIMLFSQPGFSMSRNITKLDLKLK